MCALFHNQRKAFEVAIYTISEDKEMFERITKKLGEQLVQMEMQFNEVGNVRVHVKELDS